jgi:hypothetical protein
VHERAILLEPRPSPRDTSTRIYGIEPEKAKDQPSKGLVSTALHTKRAVRMDIRLRMIHVMTTMRKKKDEIPWVTQEDAWSSAML